MIPQLIKSIAFVVVTAIDPFFVVFSLQLPCESQTVSFVSLWQFAPGALQSIVGKLGKLPLFGLLMSFHCAATRAIKHSNVNKSSLFMFKLLFLFYAKKPTLSLCCIHVWTTRTAVNKWAMKFFYRSFLRRKKSANYLLKSLLRRCFYRWKNYFLFFVEIILGNWKRLRRLKHFQTTDIDLTHLKSNISW